MRLATLLLAIGVASASAFEVEQRTCVPPSCAVLGTPHLSADGRRVVVRSSCDLDPGRNPRGRQQLFRLDASGARQLTPPGLVGARCGLDVAADATLDRLVAVVTCTRPLRSRLLESRGGRRFRPLGPWVPCDVQLEPGAMSGDGRHLVVEAGCHPTRGTPLRNPPALFVRDTGPDFVRTPRRDCRGLFASFDGDGTAATFVADCDLTGENPFGQFQLFHYDRTAKVASQISKVAPLYRCGFDEAGGSGLFVEPSISADGSTVALGHDCVAPTPEPAPPTVVFRWRKETGPVALTHDYCVDRPAGNDGSLGLSAVIPPVGLSTDGAVTAFTIACDIAGASSDNDVRVFRHRDGVARELFGYRKPSGVLGVSGVALTPDGDALAVVADGPVAGCPTTGAPQLYVLRDLATPALTGAHCACAL